MVTDLPSKMCNQLINFSAMAFVSPILGIVLKYQCGAVHVKSMMYLNYLSKGMLMR